MECVGVCAHPHGHICEEYETFRTYTGPRSIPWMALQDVAKSNPRWSSMLSVQCSECIAMHNAGQMDGERCS